MAVLTWKSHNNTMDQEVVLEEKLRSHLTAIKGNFTGRQWSDICSPKGVFAMVSAAMYNGFVVIDLGLLATVKTPAQATALYENMKTMEAQYAKELKKDPRLGI